MMELNLEKFQGPLGLLLKLIEQEELDITEIALAKIADEYLEYVKGSSQIDPEEMADFLVMAARLLYIKSKALLPYLVSVEEEEDINELEKQLKMYKEFVEASVKISTLIGKKKFLFSPLIINKNFRRPKKEKTSFVPPKGLTAMLLADRFKELLERFAAKEEPLAEKSLGIKISIEERIDYIRDMLSKKIRFSFSQFLKTASSRTEVIVNFLAVLELAKQRELVFEQDELFSEIHILSYHDNLSN